ncbi:MAG: BspA family leucine-rich repeat surface protein, partial [Muribaculaceae bacterium]|nr:BspA family leucine-rich repeat surface protein [Muribaculaceae bacterium]
GTNSSVTQVVFDPLFASARPTTTVCWFRDMYHLQSITGLEYLNTSAVTAMRYMFMNCRELANLDLSHFNTANVIDMIDMFRGCKSLRSLDLRSFNTANVTKMNDMFNTCEKLKSLDLSSFNTSNVTTMSNMFTACYNLNSLDLGNFNTANVTDMSKMFYYSHNLVTIYVGGDWSTAAVTNSFNMFHNCRKLVGGAGTTYDASHVDAAYAQIDGGTANPGYFTATFLPGDVDGDGRITIGDVSDIIDMLLSGTATTNACPAADVDGDGRITIGDVSDIIDYLLKGSW